MFLKYLFTINTLKHITLSKFVITPTCFGLSGPSSGSVMFLVFYIWCCDGMRLGVQVMSVCLVDVSVAGRVAIATRPVNVSVTGHVAIATRPATDTSRHTDIT